METYQIIFFIIMGIYLIWQVYNYFTSRDQLKIFVEELEKKGHFTITAKYLSIHPKNYSVLYDGDKHQICLVKVTAAEGVVDENILIKQISSITPDLDISVVNTKGNLSTLTRMTAGAILGGGKGMGLGALSSLSMEEKDQEVKKIDLIIRYKDNNNKFQTRTIKFIDGKQKYDSLIVRIAISSFNEIHDHLLWSMEAVDEKINVDVNDKASRIVESKGQSILESTDNEQTMNPTYVKKNDYNLNIESLERLANLKDRGMLTEDEYNDAKMKVLRNSN